MRCVIAAFVLAACSGADVSPDAPPPPPGEHLPASVGVTQSISTYATWITGTFRDGTDPATKTKVGDCVADHYIIDSFAKTFDAGRITVTGTTTHTVSATHWGPFGGGELGYQFRSETHEFVDDDILSVSSTGATVPMFSTALAMPAVAKVAKPTSSIIKRDQPLALSWTGGSGILWVVVSSGGGWISCPFQASTGAGAVSVDALATQMPGKGGLGFYTRNENVVASPPWDVVVFTANDAIWVDGWPADFDVTLE